MFGFFQSGGSDSPERARQNKNTREKIITTGTQNIAKAFAGFNDQYYNKRAQDYINFAMPQLGEQTRSAQKNLVYSLADRGLTKSTVAGEKQAELQQQAANAQAGIVDEAQGQANQERLAKAQQKSGLIEQLISAQNPMLAQQSALLGASNIPMANNATGMASMTNGIMNALLAMQVQNQTEKNKNFTYSY